MWQYSMLNFQLDLLRNCYEISANVHTCLSLTKFPDCTQIKTLHFFTFLSKYR